jgi:glycosyltransferase
LFVRKHVYERAGLFDTNFKLAADYDFIFRVFNINKFNSKYLNEFLVRMRLGGESNKNLINILKQNVEVFKVWRKYNLKMPLFFFPIKFLKRLGQFIYSIN